MPLYSMNCESEPRAASSRGVSVSKRPGLRASALQAGCVAARYWQLSQKSPFSYSISHIGITSILIPSRSKVSRWEKVMIFPCLQPVTEEAAIKPPISRSTLSSFNVQQTCISSATRSPFFTTKSHSFDS